MYKRQIQGASGSGKSTLLQILGGLEPPDAGEVRWRGESIYAWSRTRLAAWRNLTVGFVFQAYHLFPELTALENVDFPARLARRGDAKLSAELLDQVGLGSRLHHLPTELSGGEQQRIAIARALRNNPALILADEPTGNLDTASTREIMTIFERRAFRAIAGQVERGGDAVLVAQLGDGLDEIRKSLPADEAAAGDEAPRFAGRPDRRSRPGREEINIHGIREDVYKRQDPAWTRDSRHLVYADNGRLALLDTATGKSLPIPVAANSCSEPTVSR